MGIAQPPFQIQVKRLDRLASRPSHMRILQIQMNISLTAQALRAWLAVARAKGALRILEVRLSVVLCTRRRGMLWRRWRGACDRRQHRLAAAEQRARVARASAGGQVLVQWLQEAVSGREERARRLSEVETRARRRRRRAGLKAWLGAAREGREVRAAGERWAQERVSGRWREQLRRRLEQW